MGYNPNRFGPFQGAASSLPAMTAIQRDTKFISAQSKTIVTTNSTDIIAAPGADKSIFIWGYQYSCSGAYSAGTVKDGGNTQLFTVAAGVHGTLDADSGGAGTGQTQIMLPMPIKVATNKKVKVVGNAATGWNETSHVITLFYTIAPTGYEIASS